MSETDDDPDLDRDDESGTGDDGSGGGEPTAGAPAPSQEELRRRRMQSDLDRERAENARLRKQLAAKEPSGVDADDIRAQVRAEVAREHEMARTAEALREEFPFAVELLRDTTKFEGPEDMRYQASSRHAEVQAQRDSLAEDVARRVREEYGEKLSAAPKDGGSPPAPSDGLTAATVGRMGLEELLATDEQDLKRLARSIPQE